MPASAERLRAALTICADHELNVSAFTARCVASAGASLYGVEALWDSLARSSDLAGTLGQRLRRGEPIDGFGHPLYPGGDPRAKVLLKMLPKPKSAGFARSVAAAAETVLGEAPTVDFALVALARSLGLPNGAALTLFALGRTLDGSRTRSSSTRKMR